MGTVKAEPLAVRPDVMTWVEIQHLYPNEWVCLVDAVDAPDGSLRSGRVVCHAPSIEDALDELELLDPPCERTVTHTWGRSIARRFA
jgi:hypothetical protein